MKQNTDRDRETGKLLCADAYKFRRKFILLDPTEKRRCVKYANRRTNTQNFHTDMVWHGIPQPAANLWMTNMMNPRLSFIFFAFSISFLLVACALHCGRPVGLSPFCSKGNIFHVCLRRLVLHETHDREIALRNARTRVNLDEKLWETRALRELGA